MAIVCEPLGPEPKSFESPEKFLKYYNKNKDELDKLTTRELNRQFNVEGYHFGRKRGALRIEQWEGHSKYYTPRIKDLSELEHRIEALESKLTLVAEYISHLHQQSA
jgi:hypothetical protein